MKYYVNRTNPALYGIDSIFSDLFGDSRYSGRIPRTDVYETPSSYVVEAEVAGYRDEDISVSVEKHVLTIATIGKALDKERAEEEKEEKKEERNYLVREIYRPSFSRSFTLPEDVDEDGIEADKADGILTVVLPRITKSQRGRIEVKIGK